MTKGKYEVINVLGFNTKAKSIVYQSNQNTPIQYSNFSVNVASGKITLLDNGEGTHYATLSANGLYLMDRWSSPKTFRQYDLVATTKPAVTKLHTDGNPWTAYNVPEITSGSIKAADGQTDLYYRLVKPVNFDPNKKYPTVVYVYGGPHAHNVEAAWNYLTRPWEVYMAQRGYVVFVVDNRGSENRGFEFESCTPPFGRHRDAGSTGRREVS